jgi:uncharacterized protein YndB with AHSA1/START domain
MGRSTVDVRARSAAPPEAVYALLVDGASWPSWSGHDSFELVEPGEAGGESLGAVRILRRGRLASRERIVELVPGRRLGYELLSGLPLSDYRGDVDLGPADGGGTAIHWHSSFTAKVPGTGWLYARVLRRFIQRAADGLARRAAAPPA